MTTQSPDARSPWTLRFLDPELEDDYRKKLLTRARRQIRLTMLASLPLWPAAALVAEIYIERTRWLWIVAAAMTGVLLAILLAERFARSLNTIHVLGLFGNTSAGLAAIAGLWLVNVFDAIGPLTILNITVFNFGLASLPFVFTIAANMPYVLLCVVLMFLSPGLEMFGLQALVLGVGVAAAAIGTYMREAAQRRDFYLSRIIADQERELEAERKRQLGQYTLESKLGQGGMGVVYRAKHALLRRPTAVKLLSTDDASERDLARFEREVQLTSELSHPNIIAIYDYGRSPLGEFYYAMEYLPGIDLESLIARFGPMPAGRVVPILAQIADALAEAHHRGLIHRDIKPGNILLSRMGTRSDVVKVLDFGLVKDVDAPSELTADNQIAGTPAYLAPEALTDPDQIGPASDIYAVGAVGFFLLTGERVFDGKTLAEICAHHIHTEPRAPSLVTDDATPKALDAIILRCLAKKPTDRLSARDLHRELTSIEVERWTRADEFWNAFEASVAAPPPAQTPKELTVDLRERGD